MVGGRHAPASGMSHGQHAPNMSCVCDGCKAEVSCKHAAQLLQTVIVRLQSECGKLVLVPSMTCQNSHPLHPPQTPMQLCQADRAGHEVLRVRETCQATVQQAQPGRVGLIECIRQSLYPTLDVGLYRDKIRCRCMQSTYGSILVFTLGVTFAAYTRMWQ